MNCCSLYVLVAAVLATASAAVSFHDTACKTNLASAGTDTVCPSWPSSISCSSATECYASARAPGSGPFGVYRITTPTDSFDSSTDLTAWQLLPAKLGSIVTINSVMVFPNATSGVYAAGHPIAHGDYCVAHSSEPGVKPLTLVPGTFDSILSVSRLPGEEPVAAAFYRIPPTSGIYLINADGILFARKHFSESFKYVTPMAISFASADDWWVAGRDDWKMEGHLYRSTDRGASWTSMRSLPGSDSYFAAIDCCPRGCVAVAAGGSTTHAVFIHLKPEISKYVAVDIEEHKGGLVVDPATVKVKIAGDGRTAIITGTIINPAAVMAAENEKLLSLLGNAHAHSAGAAPAKSAGVIYHVASSDSGAQITRHAPQVLATAGEASFAGEYGSGVAVGTGHNGEGVFTVFTEY